MLRIPLVVFQIFLCLSVQTFHHDRSRQEFLWVYPGKGSHSFLASLGLCLWPNLRGVSRYFSNTLPASRLSPFLWYSDDKNAGSFCRCSTGLQASVSFSRLFSLFFFFFVLGQFSWSFLKRTDLMLLCPRLRRPSNFIFSYQLIFQFYELHLVNLHCFCFYGQDVQFLPICFKRMYNWSLKHFCDDRFEILVR